jgi:hypothetical protein
MIPIFPVFHKISEKGIKPQNRGSTEMQKAPGLYQYNKARNNFCSSYSQLILIDGTGVVF